MKDQGRKGLRARFQPALFLSAAAVFLAMSGAAVALPGTGTVNSGDVKDNALKSEDLKDGKAVSGLDVVPDSIGAASLGTFHVHSDSVVVNGGAAENASYNTGTVTADCGAGEQLISGGGRWTNNANGEELFISEIEPSPPSNSVTVTGGNDSGNDRTLVATAVCLG